MDQFKACIGKIKRNLAMIKDELEEKPLDHYLIGKKVQLTFDIEWAEHFHSKQYDLKSRIQQELLDCDHSEFDNGKIEAFNLINNLL